MPDNTAGALNTAFNLCITDDYDLSIHGDTGMFFQEKNYSVYVQCGVLLYQSYQTGEIPEALQFNISATRAQLLKMTRTYKKDEQKALAVLITANVDEQNILTALMQGIVELSQYKYFNITEK